MELWIRSQDKKILIKIDMLEYGFWNGHHRIYVNDIIIASYKTKERALEVLDEIQNILSKPQSHEEDGTTYYMPNDGSSKIYEMPKE